MCLFLAEKSTKNIIESDCLVRFAIFPWPQSWAVYRQIERRGIYRFTIEISFTCVSE